jgi:homoserine O-acetyltransferase
MDALVPIAAQPTAVASRNWMLRRMMLETIRNDPDYNNGDYTTQPRSMKLASVFFGIATAGGTLNYQKIAPTREQADKIVDARLAAAMTADANDFLWQWGSSADYDPAPDLEKIQASVLAINAADDERNPPETGVMERAMRRKEGDTLRHPGKRGDERPSHHRQRQILQATASGISGIGAAVSQVGRDPTIAAVTSSRDSLWIASLRSQ